MRIEKGREGIENDSQGGKKKSDWGRRERGQKDERHRKREERTG